MKKIEGDREREMDLLEILKHLNKDEKELDSLNEKELDEIDHVLNEIRNSLGLKYDFVYFKRYYLSRKMKEAAPLVKTGKKFNLNQKEKRNKRKTWNNLTHEQILERNKIIKAAFARKKGTDNAFFKQQGRKYNRSASAIRKIVES